MKENKSLDDFALFFSIFALILSIVTCNISCTKSGYKPDHDQVSCMEFYDIREIWGDSASNYIRTDTLKPKYARAEGKNYPFYLICTPDQIENTKRMMKVIEASPWHKVCSVNGEPLYWEYWNPELK